MSFQIIRSNGSLYIQQILRPKLKQIEEEISALKARGGYDEFLEKLNVKSEEISNQLTEQTEIKIDKIAQDILKNVTETLNSSLSVLESVRQEIKDLSTEAKQVAILAETIKQEIKEISNQTITGVKDNLIKKLIESKDFIDELKKVLLEEQGDQGSTDLQKETTEILKATVTPLKKSAKAIQERIKDLKLQLPTVTESELQKELKDLIKVAESISVELLVEIADAENKLGDVLNNIEGISKEELEKTIKNYVSEIEENLKADLEKIIKNINLDDKIKKNLIPEVLKDLLKDVNLDDKITDALKDTDLTRQITEALKTADLEEHVKKELTPEVLKDLLKDVNLDDKITDALKDTDLTRQITEALKTADLEEHVKKELTPEVLKDLLKDVNLDDKITDALKDTDLTRQITEALKTADLEEHVKRIAPKFLKIS
ncbi:hypothetical protein [Lymphocystis disease virus 2]|uniref:Uncharacterized protein n=1 Tax=Lymphocystis disease virus 2 TaxID=159183 RepID=A0A6F8X1Z3_9VIRU|nr:hypothetical protein [Lymphocystis disease virus 2]